MQHNQTQPDYAHLLRETPTFSIIGFVRDIASLGAIASFVAVLCMALENIT